MAVFSHKLVSLYLCHVLAIFLSIPSVQAQLSLNFESHPSADFILGGYQKSDAPFACGIPNHPDNSDCLIGLQNDPDSTIFLNERVPISEGIYWHLVIIDPENEFAMEVYTPVTGFFLSNSGGHEPVFMTLNGNLQQWSGNGWDPLESSIKTFGPDNVSFSGNATGDPTKAIIRQILGPGTLTQQEALIKDWVCDPNSFCQEYLKSEFDFKPKITQQLHSDDLRSLFELDMTHISYSEQNIAGDMRITQEVIDSTIPIGSLYFDAETDLHESSLNAGQYIHTPGIGWYDDGDGDMFYAFDRGNYEYADGGIKATHLEQNWMMFYDPAQNEYPGNKAKCEALNLDACNLPPIDYR